MDAAVLLFAAGQEQRVELLGTPQRTSNSGPVATGLGPTVRNLIWDVPEGDGAFPVTARHDGVRRAVLTLRLNCHSCFD